MKTKKWSFGSYLYSENDIKKSTITAKSFLGTSSDIS
jgi:hypothetical protein